MTTSFQSDKLYYTIGEVSRTVELPTSVIRFWETEFRGLKPPRHHSGKRLYRQVDIDKIIQIKTLLYEQRFTIEGAKQALDGERITPITQPVQQSFSDFPLPIMDIKKDLLEILALIDR